MQTLTTKQSLALLKRGESETVEFKKAFDREAIETLSAFANTRDGRVFIGVSDTDQVLGVDLSKETVQNWIEKYGTGIRRIRQGFADYGLPEPRFEEIGGGFRVTAYKSMDSMEKVTQVTGSVLKLIAFCVEPKSRKELMAHLDIKHREHFRSTRSAAQPFPEVSGDGDRQTPAGTEGA